MCFGRKLMFAIVCDSIQLKTKHQWIQNTLMTLPPTRNATLVVAEASGLTT
jgi:hypothetical protein